MRPRSARRSHSGYDHVMAKESYLELYKKYRPTTWSEVVGQDHIVADLKNAVVSGHLPTAYLFAGPKGTGKTTVAKILAKAINCERPDGEGDPCCECSTCKSIDAGTCPGVHYVSAANYGDVASVRSFMEQARRMSVIKKPIWIIDEIQNLSKQAFDALLIPLEDVKMPSLFIFCTTEIKKVPETITSRVQSRAFSLVPSDGLYALCERILEKEGYEKVDNDKWLSDVEAMGPGGQADCKEYCPALIGRAIKQANVGVGGGSARETLSKLEKLVTNPRVEDKNWGNVIAKDLFKRHDATRAIFDLGNAIKDGRDARDVTKELVNLVRDMIILLHMDPRKIDASMSRRRGNAEELGDEVLLRCFSLLGEAQRDMQMDDDARIYLEIALIKISRVVPAPSSKA